MCFPMSSLRYHPNLCRGPFSFDTTPRPTQEVLEIIGQEGVNEIHKILSEIVKYRKLMYGTFDPKHYGLYESQRFVCLESKYEFILKQGYTGATLNRTVRPNRVYNLRNRNLKQDDYYSIKVLWKTQYKYKAVILKHLNNYPISPSYRDELVADHNLFN